MMIRRAEIKDMATVNALLEQVNRIHHEGRPDLFRLARKYTDEQLAEIFADDTRPVFVATDEADAVLGYVFCIMEEIKDDPMRVAMKSVYIDDLCVDEKVRGQNVGKTLYEYVKAFAKEQGCYHVTLNVWTINPVARAFYGHLGMTPLKTVMEEVL